MCLLVTSHKKDAGAKSLQFLLDWIILASPPRNPTKCPSTADGAGVVGVESKTRLKCTRFVYRLPRNAKRPVRVFWLH